MRCRSSWIALAIPAALFSCSGNTGHGVVYGEATSIQTRPLAGHARSRTCHLVVVCTPDCPFCAELAAAPPRGAVWLMIGSREDVTRFASRHSLPLGSIDWLPSKDSGETLRRLNISGTPTGIVIDSQNVVREIRMDNISSAMADSICAARGN